MTGSSAIRYCRTCNKILLGRSDQVYCDDPCRNAYNKNKAKAEKIPPHLNQKAIFKIIQRNYEILMKLPPKGIHPGYSLSFDKEKIPSQFNKNFYTGTCEDKDGFWHICFDRGWKENGDSIVLKDFPDKSRVI